MRLSGILSLPMSRRVGLVRNRRTSRASGRLPDLNLHKLRLRIPQRETVSTQAELDWIAERSAAEDFHLGAVAEAHLEKPAAEIDVSPDGNDAPPAADAEAVQ